MPGQWVPAAGQSRQFAANAALESGDAKMKNSVMEASVSLELRLAAEAVTMKAEAEGFRRNGHCRQRQHRAWKERWPWHVYGAVYIVPLCLVLCRFLSYRYCIQQAVTAEQPASRTRNTIFSRVRTRCIRAQARALFT